MWFDATNSHGFAADRPTDLALLEVEDRKKHKRLCLALLHGQRKGTGRYSRTHSAVVAVNRSALYAAVYPLRALQPGYTDLPRKRERRRVERKQ
jgi:hypothetical protein